jgi:16S rRNA (cytosine1402-N4)-methyltransferase
MRAHLPVMVDEVLRYLVARLTGLYIDLTLGLGGHTEALLERVPEARVIAVDRDTESMALARERLSQFGDRVRFVQGRFSEVPRLLDEAGIDQVDGMLADLGPSYLQLTEGERGFSYNQDFPLDMRMDRRSGRTAADIVNHAAERDISELLYTLGEERRARRVARFIFRARPIRSTRQLAEAVGEAVPGKWTHAVVQRVFMALRMAVNDELEELGALLEAAPARVRPGGRLVVLTFHSLEDRMVKQSFQSLAREGRATILTKKVVRPEEEEQARNPASRSCKLRSVEIR